MIELNYVNFLSIGLLGTGLAFCVRIVRKITSKKCKCKAIYKKTVVITGATSGLGEACAKVLAERNCRLIIGCRNQKLGEKVINDIRKSNAASDVKMIPLDLSDLESIQQFSKNLNDNKIDILINNAGVMAGHFRMIQSTKTEEAMAVNYLGHFYLTNLLLPNLLQKRDGDTEGKNDRSRIIFISSSLSKHGRLDIDQLDLSKDPYSPKQAYANSKLALNIFARELHRRYHGNEVGVNVISMFTNGMVNTRLSRHILSSYSVFLRPILRVLLYLFLKDSSDACHPIVHCALSEELATASGGLYADFASLPWPDNVIDTGSMPEDLWQKSCDLVGLKLE